MKIEINGQFCMDERDQKILHAMMSNLNSFILDANRKGKSIGAKEVNIGINFKQEWEPDTNTIQWATDRVLNLKYRGMIDGDIAAEVIQTLEDPNYYPWITEDDEYAEDEEDDEEE
jgi:hypothetical protein